VGVRLATFNVLHGRSLVDGRVDADRFAEAIGALDADVLGMQEVDHAQPRSGHLDLTTLAASALGAGHYRFAAALAGTPGERFRALSGDAHGGEDGEPHFGVALVSRFPVRSWHITRLRAAPVRSPVYAPGPGGRWLLLRDEPRLVLAAVLETPAGPVTVATTHLSFVPGWNAGQLRRAVRALRRLPGPRLLLGDLNMPAGVARLFSRWEPLAHRATYPSTSPRVQLDHVLGDRTTRERATVVAADTPESPVSDHRPLVVQLSWPARSGA
jgi:endonuclease/exonuclease/phosphatase family metal-dependent hydrolase